MSTTTHERIEHITTMILSAMVGTTGIASTLDGVEQIGRIILLLISIISGILIILVNWDKAVARLKKFFK